MYNHKVNFAHLCKRKSIEEMEKVIRRINNPRWKTPKQLRAADDLGTVAQWAMEVRTWRSMGAQESLASLVEEAMWKVLCGNVEKREVKDSSHSLKVEYFPLTDSGYR